MDGFKKPRNIVDEDEVGLQYGLITTNQNIAKDKKVIVESEDEPPLSQQAMEKRCHENIIHNRPRTKGKISKDSALRPVSTLPLVVVSFSLSTSP